MPFLNLIRSDLCHPPQDLVLTSGPALYCNACGRNVIDNLYEYINPSDSRDYVRSAKLAQAYSAWTGDEQVPMSFPLTHITGILDTVIVGQRIDRVRKSIRLLRALNAPFTEQPQVEPCQDMDTFLADFLNIVYEHPSAESTLEQMTLDTLMKSMYTMLKSKDAVNPFETYFNSLVPYVMRCHNQWTPMPVPPEPENLADQLYFHIFRSHYVRHFFGRYAIPFEVIHVMVCCYACSSSMETVANWALDFIDRICRGDFFWKKYVECDFVQTMVHVISKEITYKDNNRLYKMVVNPIKSGESIEHYSQMLEPLHEAMTLLKDKFKVPGCTPDILDIALVQMFPAVLFNDHADQLGFSMGYNHIIMNVNHHGQLPKGVFRKAREIHRLVRDFATRVTRFDEQHLTWTLDTLRLFFASDREFEKTFRDALQMLVEQREE